jgi:hypothetical protein
MAYMSKPVFWFEDDTETGIDEIGLGSLVFVEASHSMLSKVSNSGLSNSSTIADAITANALVEAFNLGDGNLKSDGSVPMDGGYAPNLDQDIATKVSVVEEVITRLETDLMFDLGLFKC